MTKRLKVLSMNIFIVLLLIQERDVVSPLDEQYNLSNDSNAQEQEIVSRLRHIFFKQLFEGLNKKLVEFEQVQYPCDTEEC